MFVWDQVHAWQVVVPIHLPMYEPDNLPKIKFKKKKWAEVYLDQ